MGAPPWLAEGASAIKGLVPGGAAPTAVSAHGRAVSTAAEMVRSCRHRRADDRLLLEPAAPVGRNVGRREWNYSPQNRPCPPRPGAVDLDHSPESPPARPSRSKPTRRRLALAARECQGMRNAVGRG